jgi:hypothetical protein
MHSDFSRTNVRWVYSTRTTCFSEYPTHVLLSIHDNTHQSFQFYSRSVTLKTQGIFDLRITENILLKNGNKWPQGCNVFQFKYQFLWKKTPRFQIHCANEMKCLAEYKLNNPVSFHSSEFGIIFSLRAGLSSFSL